MRIEVLRERVVSEGFNIVKRFAFKFAGNEDSGMDYKLVHCYWTVVDVYGA